MDLQSSNSNPQPRLASEGPAVTGLTAKPPLSLQDLQRLKRRPVKSACISCRDKRQSCDGQRPSCHRCRDAGVTCVYITRDVNESNYNALRRENQELKAQAARVRMLIAQHVPHIPGDDSALSIQRYHSMDELQLLQEYFNSVSAQQQSLHIPPTISEQVTARGVLPPFRSDFDFEVSVRHPISYPTIVEYTDPLNTGVTGIQSEVPNSNDYQLKVEINIDPSLRLVDARLQQLNIVLWTDIWIDSQEAAQIISLYLEMDHPMLGFFEPDLFICDLISGDTQYCSSFLVVSLLAWASQAYTAINPAIARLSQVFLSVALDMLQQDGLEDSFSSLTALHLLCLTSAYHGIATSITGHLDQARSMARRLGLVRSDKLQNNSVADRWTPEQLRARGYAAWSTFVVQSNYCAFQLADPIQPPTHIPVPGWHISSEDADGNVYVPPVYMGPVFVSYCRLWQTFAPILERLHTVNFAATDKDSIYLAQKTYLELVEWVDLLPDPMQNKPGCLPHVLIFHAWFHMIILGIFRPIIPDEQQHGGYEDSSFSDPAQAVFAASMKQLKHIAVVLFNEESSTYRSGAHASLIHIANAVVREPITDSSRSYVRFCVQYYQKLSYCFRFTKLPLKGILFMALKRNILSVAEVQQLVRTFEAQVQPYDFPTPCEGDWQLDLGLPMHAFGEGKAAKMAEDLDNIMAFEAFVNRDVVFS